METKKELKEVFAEYYKWHGQRIDILEKFISGLIRSRSVNLQKVAESMEGRAKVESNYRRIQRLFKEQTIDYKVTAKLLSSILPNDEKWVLTMDRTNWKLGKSNINLLVLGVEKIASLTADREFIGEEWFKWLKEKKIPFVIRIKSNTLIDEEYFGSRDLKELFSHTNKDEFYAFGKTKIFGTELYLGGIEATKSKEALILVSDHKIDKETLPIYKKRWEIETLFGALKSKGFNFEESKLTDGYKIEKLMAFLSIAFIWSILAGDYREQEKPIPLKKRAL